MYNLFQRRRTQNPWSFVLLSQTLWSIWRNSPLTQGVPSPAPPTQGANGTITKRLTYLLENEISQRNISNKAVRGTWTKILADREISRKKRHASADYVTHFHESSKKCRDNQNYQHVTQKNTINCACIFVYINTDTRLSLQLRSSAKDAMARIMVPKVTGMVLEQGPWRIPENESTIW